MINGTSGAIHAMIMGTLSPGDTVLVPRNAHRSMIGALILADVTPVYIQPRIDKVLGIPMGLELKDIVATADEHPEAKALLLVYPTYYGVTIDLAAVAAFVHSRDMLLLVDEAHGPHLKFSDKLPQQALDAGADMAAQSTHKILGSMTQTSILLARSARVDLERVRSAASLLQSTSPNQLLLASLDIARLQMAEQGTELVNRAVNLAEKLRQAVNEIPGLWSFGADYLPDGESLDLTKVTVSVRRLGITGVQAESILRHQYKIQCELSDAYNLLFIISYADTEAQVRILTNALQGLAEQFAGAQELVLPVEIPPVPSLGLEPRAAFFAGRETIDFEEAAGCIAAEQVMFYPPGIPILAPGDVIEPAAMYYIRSMQQLGLKVVGPADTTLKTIQIVREISR
jgi:arginine/lysine/ornithine decarboxylase